MTLTFHLHDIKILHVDPLEVTQCIEWFKSIYGTDVRISRGTTHDYLGVMLSYSNKQVRISMADYVKKVINGFIEDIHGSASTPGAENLFQIRNEEARVKLNYEQAQVFSQHGRKTAICYHAVQERHSNCCGLPCHSSDGTRRG